LILGHRVKIFFGLFNPAPIRYKPVVNLALDGRTVMGNARTTAPAHSLQARIDNLDQKCPLVSRPCGLCPSRAACRSLSPGPTYRGRHSDADIRLTLPDISRRHLPAGFSESEWRVHDLSSLNGVFVNGEQVQEAALYHGDALQLGSSVFVVACKRMGNVTDRTENLQHDTDAGKEQKRAS